MQPTSAARQVVDRRAQEPADDDAAGERDGRVDPAEAVERGLHQPLGRLGVGSGRARRRRPRPSAPAASSSSTSPAAGSPTTRSCVAASSRARAGPTYPAASLMTATGSYPWSWSRFVACRCSSSAHGMPAQRRRIDRTNQVAEVREHDVRRSPRREPPAPGRITHGVNNTCMAHMWPGSWNYSRMAQRRASVADGRGSTAARCDQASGARGHPPVGRTGGPRSTADPAHTAQVVEHDQSPALRHRDAVIEGGDRTRSHGDQRGEATSTRRDCRRSATPPGPTCRDQPCRGERSTRHSSAGVPSTSPGACTSRWRSAS